jgi:preprotein translocase subunit SecA
MMNWKAKPNCSVNAWKKARRWTFTGTHLGDAAIVQYHAADQLDVEVTHAEHALTLIGGMVLNDRCIAEMRTGEGKTLTATLPAYLNARRKLHASLLQADPTCWCRRSDRGTQTTDGYSRHHAMAFSPEERVQRKLHYALVDEVDSILIDEARTPLIISGTQKSPSPWWVSVSSLSWRIRCGMILFTLV